MQAEHVLPECRSVTEQQADILQSTLLTETCTGIVFHKLWFLIWVFLIGFYVKPFATGTGIFLYRYCFLKNLQSLNRCSTYLIDEKLRLRSICNLLIRICFVVYMYLQENISNKLTAVG